MELGGFSVIIGAFAFSKKKENVKINQAFNDFVAIVIITLTYFPDKRLIISIIMLPLARCITI